MILTKISERDKEDLTLEHEVQFCQNHLCNAVRHSEQQAQPVSGKTSTFNGHHTLYCHHHCSCVAAFVK